MEFELYYTKGNELPCSGRCQVHAKFVLRHLTVVYLLLELYSAAVNRTRVVLTFEFLSIPFDV